jgi:hypothetical protein
MIWINHEVEALRFLGIVDRQRDIVDSNFLHVRFLLPQAVTDEYYVSRGVRLHDQRLAHVALLNDPDGSQALRTQA